MRTMALFVLSHDDAACYATLWDRYLCVAMVCSMVIACRVRQGLRPAVDKRCSFVLFVFLLRGLDTAFQWRLYNSTSSSCVNLFFTTITCWPACRSSSYFPGINESWVQTPRCSKLFLSPEPTTQRAQPPVPDIGRSTSAEDKWGVVIEGCPFPSFIHFLSTSHSATGHPSEGVAFDCCRFIMSRFFVY